MEKRSDPGGIVSVSLPDIALTMPPAGPMSVPAPAMQRPLTQS